MEYEIVFIDKYDEKCLIKYNGQEFGEWDNAKTIDCPEDLIIGRDLNYLIDVGIKIGKEIINSQRAAESKTPQISDIKD